MFPQNGLSATPVVGNIEVELRTERREEFFLGGATMGSASTPTSYTGKRDTPWSAGYEDGFVYVQANGGTRQNVFEQPSIREFSICFDRYMLPVIVYVYQSGVYLRRFDVATKSYVTTNISNGIVGEIVTPRLCFDDRRAYFRTRASVLLAFYVGNKLYIKTSDDNFVVTKLLRTEPVSEIYLEQIAMGDNNRIHFVTYTLQDI